MNFIVILFSAIFISLIGLSVIQLFSYFTNKSFIEKFGFAWGIGVGLLGLQMFLYSLVNIHWSRVSIVLPWIILFCYTVFKITSWRFPKVKTNKIDKLLFALILLLLVFVGFESVLRPIQAWDGFSSWLIRPKVFFLQNNLSIDFVHYQSDEYPVIMPLMDTFGYIMLGKIDDRNVLFFYFMFYLALGALFFITVKKTTSTTWALFFTFLLLSTQNILRHGGRYETGYADLALGYYFFGCSCILVEFIKTKKIQLLLFLSLLLGITVQIKNDAIPFFIVFHIIVVALIVKWRKYNYFLTLVPSLSMYTLWTLYKYFNAYPVNNMFRSQTHFHFDKLFGIGLGLFKEFFNFQNWSILWIVFFIVIILFYKNLQSVKVYLLILFIQWLSYFSIFLVTPADPIKHVDNVSNRLYLHLAPLAVLIIAKSIYARRLSEAPVIQIKNTPRKKLASKKPKKVKS